MRTLVVSPHLRHQTEQLSRLAEKFSLVRARMPQLEVDQGGLIRKITVTRKLLLALAVIPLLSWNLQGESDLQEAKELEALHSPTSFPSDFIVDGSAFFLDLSLCVLKWLVSVVSIQFRKHPGCVLLTSCD